jgi:hypothetical protein
MLAKNRMKVRPASGPEVRELAELHYAVRQRGKHQRNHDEEQHSKEHLSERVEQGRGEPLGAGQQRRNLGAYRQHDRAGDRAEHEAEKDAVGEPGVDVGHAGC